MKRLTLLNNGRHKPDKPAREGQMIKYSLCALVKGE